MCVCVWGGVPRWHATDATVCSSQYLTLLQCCPTSDGAGAAVLASEAFVRKHGLEGLAVEIVEQQMATDSPKAVNGSSIELAGADMTRRATQTLYKNAGIGAKDVQVIELHDCFSANEVRRRRTDMPVPVSVDAAAFA
jgi:acetyl-CoA acetyltransferase